MKLMRTISLLLAISLLSSCFLSVGALEMTERDLVVVHDEEKNNRIDALFALRSKLELDYEANEEQINQIDSQLKQLGVESISYVDLLNKLGVDALPDVSVTSTSTTSWTSRRTVVTYRGQQYELQIIEGVPIDGDSPLRDNQVVVDYEAEGFEAGAMNALAVAVETKVGDALSSVPIVGTIYTVYDVLCSVVDGFADSYSESTIIDRATGSATVILTTHMKYIFVKGYGSGDSWQILGYMGNAVEYMISSTIVVDIPNEDELLTYPVTTVTPETTKEAPYYSDYTLAVSNYYQYRNTGNENFTYYYIVHAFEIEVLGETRKFSVPVEEAPVRG